MTTKDSNALTGMTAEERNAFLERTSATAIANQAILKCSLSGYPPTADNVTMFVDDFLDPENPHLEDLMMKIILAIDEVIDCKERAEKLTNKRH